MIDLALIAQQCAPQIHPITMAHVVKVESNGNPFAIGVVGAHLERQPRNEPEAIATAAWLESHHFNYSVGLAQVNRSNFKSHGLTLATAFEPCRNLRAAAEILTDCFVRAQPRHPNDQQALRNAFSCYNSGHFLTEDTAGYVLKVVTGHAPRRLGHQTDVKDPAETEVTDATLPQSALMF